MFTFTERHDLVSTYVTSCFVVVLFLFEVWHGCSKLIQAIMNNTGVYMGILLFSFFIFARGYKLEPRQ